MSLELTRVDPLTCDNWNSWIRAEDDSNPFYCSGWAHVLRDSYDYRPHYLVLRDGVRFSALLPFMEIDSAFTGRRGVSLPFSDECHPLIGKDIEPSDVMSAATAYAEGAGWRYLDLHGGRNLLPDAPASSEYVGHRLDLSDNSALQFSRLRATTRRNVRKARRSGVAVDISRSKGALNEFYRLHCLTRKRHMLPPQPSRFFLNIYVRMLLQDSGHVVRAAHKGKTVGAAVLFHFGDQVLFKFGASDLGFQHLRMNDLILWKAIEWSIKNGYRALFLGRTDVWNTGLRRFKSGWGSVEYPIEYHKYDVKNKVFVKHSSERLEDAIKPIVGIMPIAVLRTVGGLLYRHLG